MPLRAVCDIDNLHAFDFDAQAWAELKKSYRSMGLHMPCCESSAVPKTSSLGTFFFAHAKVGNCTTGPETPEHLFCKKIIAKAAQKAGWTAVTEKAGTTPSGEAWVADVFCEKGAAKIAFEVQISSQAHEETLRRQLRYKDSGVRGAWFYGPKLQGAAVGTDRNTPIFKLSKIEAGYEPQVERFGVPLSRFVAAMLTKRLVWTRSSSTEPFYLGYFRTECRKCKVPTKLIYGHSDSTSEELHVSISGAVTPASISTALSRVQSVITNDELVGLGFALIAQVHGHRRDRFENWLCLKCGVVMGNEMLSSRVNMSRYSPAPTAVNDDGELVEHPVGLELIDRKNDDCGYWTLMTPASEP